MKNYNRLLAAFCVALISFPALAGRNGSGTYSAPSNSWNPVVSGTTIDSSDFNDLLTDLEDGLTASIAKDGQTTTSARIPFASGVSAALGSTASVSYGFTGDLNTGIYSSAADKIGLVAGGTEQLRIESAVFHGVTNNTVDVGSSSVKFKDGYFAGTLTTGPVTATGTVTSGNSTTSSGIFKILEDADAGSNYTQIKVPSLSANYDLTLPADDGDANELWSTDGSGSGDWVKVGAANISSAMITGQTDATIAAGDTILFTDASDSGNLKEDDVQGLLDLVPDSITLGTATASTSGTAVDFGSIPAGTKQVVISFMGVSTNGTSDLIVQLGDSGGIETSGYLGSACLNTDSGSTVTTFTTGYGLTGAIVASVVLHGQVVISLANSSSNTWTSSVNLGVSSADQTHTGGGSKSLSATLDRLRITTVGGSDTFDAGSINIAYE